MALTSRSQPRRPMTDINTFEGRPEKQARWDGRYIGLAHYIAQWSKDPRAKVGAVLVNQRFARVVATGFNGFPSNVEDSAERLENKARKLQMILHAEQNALLHAGRDARDCDAYVVGKPVCNVCATLLIQSGVRRVVAAAPRPGTESYWDRVGLLAIEMLREANVEFIPITGQQLDAIGLNRDDARASENPLSPYEGLQDELDLGY
ncbi:MAG: deoxycytidylate deaminase [Roseomonas sp.]|jgi:dCMP deaminase|nr:deoxycytidylate deaminase [Roseomonas sp.]